MAVDLSAVVSALQEAVTGSDPRDREGFALLSQTISEEANGTLGPPSGGEYEEFHFRDLTPYLKVYRFVRPRPWIMPVGIGVFIVGIIGIAYFLGFRRGR